jgi:HSP20 family protein
MSLLTRIERWDPMDELATLRRRMDRLVGNMMREEEGLSPREWSPTTDVVENDDAIIVKAELPGVAAKDITVDVENGMLTLHGEKAHETEKEEKGYRRMERSYGKFFRSFTIPPNVDAKGIKASYVDGLLEVTLPKTGEAKATRIKIDLQPSAKPLPSGQAPEARAPKAPAPTVAAH